MLKSFAGGRLFGVTWGPRPATVLALHGWRRSHSDFDAVFGGTAATAGAVGLDLFGFGATPPPPGPWGSIDYARAVAQVFADAEALAERVVVVGHSFGGRVALGLWEQVPDRIAAMVLAGVPLLPRAGPRPRVARPYRLARRLNRFGLVGDARLEAFRRRYGSPDYQSASGVMRDVFVRLLAEDYRAVMSRIGCPVHLVWGEADSEVPVEVAERAVGLFPSASLTVLPGAGHLVPTEAPDELAGVVAEAVGRPWPEGKALAPPALGAPLSPPAPAPAPAPGGAAGPLP